MTRGNRRVAAARHLFGLGLLAGVGVLSPSGCGPGQEGSVVLKTAPDAKTVVPTTGSVPASPRTPPRPKAEQGKKVFSPG